MRASIFIRLIFWANVLALLATISILYITRGPSVGLQIQCLLGLSVSVATYFMAGYSTKNTSRSKIGVDPVSDKNSNEHVKVWILLALPVVLSASSIAAMVLTNASIDRVALPLIIMFSSAGSSFSEMQEFEK